MMEFKSYAKLAFIALRSRQPTFRNRDFMLSLLQISQVFDLEGHFRVIMATLNIASKANQATTFPALLVGHYAKKSDPNASINVNFEEVEALKSEKRSVVELVAGSGTSSYGTEEVLSGLVEIFTVLQDKNEKLVGRDVHYRRCYNDLRFRRSKSGYNAQFRSSRLISSPWKAHCSS